VTLGVSKGPKPVPVGAVVGQAVADAINLLRAQEFRSRIVRVPSTAPAGEVVAQHPKAGAISPPNAVVRLNVSAGTATQTAASATTSDAPPPTATDAPVPVASSSSPTASALVQVPDLEGTTLREARRLLRKLGLVIDVRRVPNTQPLGTIIAQAKKPPTRLKPGSHLFVTVSTGPAQPNPPSTNQSSSGDGASISVPDVTGEDERTATDDLQSAGLSVRVVDRDTSEVSEDGIVIQQTPPANAPVRPDSAVTIYVGRYSQQQ
jgi:beta-lactam-binding protein with PASTA domain